MAFVLALVFTFLGSLSGLVIDFVMKRHRLAQTLEIETPDGKKIKLDVSQLNDAKVAEITHRLASARA